MKKEIPFQVIKGQLWVHHEGRNFVYESQSKKSLKKASASDIKSGQITAPMPGKITKLLKTLNQEVKAGEAILVMEAMKMEYTLKSDVDGVLSNLNCKVGEQVVLGKLLAQIKGNI